MKFNKQTFPNGLRVVTLPMKGSPSVTVLTMVEAGSKYETKEINGLSHFLEHMCFKGTTKRPKASDISRELDSVGAVSNAFTGQEYTGYYAKAHPKHTAKILDVIADMYLDPIFDPKEIEKEKGVIVEEINMIEDMPHRQVQYVYLDLLYGDQPAGWSVLGTKDNIRSITRNNFVNYRRANYVASSTIVFVAGDINEKQIVKDVEKLFSGVSTGDKQPKLNVKEKQTSPAIKIEKKDTDQTHLILGVRSFPAKDKRTPALTVLNSVLSGGMSARLFQKLRDEMGVAYYVRSNSDSYTDHGSLDIFAGVATDRLKESIKALMGELKRIRDEKVPANELRKAKDYLIGTMYLGLEASDDVANFVAEQEILKREILMPEELAKQIEVVTAGEIQKVAQEIIQNKNLNCAIISKSAKEADLLPLLSF